MQAVISNPLEYRQNERQAVRVATTLYDVIEAVSEQVPSDEQYLLTPSVLTLFEGLQGRLLINGSD